MPPESPRRKLAKAKAPSSTTAKTSKPSDPKLKNAPESTESKASDKLDTAFEKKIGFSSDTLKELFTKKEKDKDSKVNKLKDLLRARCLDGRNFALRNWRTNAAIDEACNAANRQITPTLIGKIMSGDRTLTPTQIQKELESWGLPESTLFTAIRNPDGSVKEKILSKETFTTVKVPIVPSLLNARVSKLFAERDIEPFLSFDPVRNTEEWQVIGEIITKLASQMANGFCWKADYRKLRYDSLKYSCGLMFPVESWYCEKDEDEDGKEFTAKEGLRYNVPPAGRTAWDQTYRPSTINSDTGCEWAMYYRLAKFSDVDQNPAYYNKDQISYSATNWIGEGSPYRTYFEWVYPCTMDFPVRPTSNSKSTGREENAGIYTTADGDKAIFVTDMFCKLSPAQWGLSDYKPKVWVKFVLASDGDITYAEPHPYCPPLYLGTSPDDSIATPSFALEVIPWQDLVGNVLTDILTAMKQNNIKVILYDKLQITEAQIQEMILRAKESGSACWMGMDWKDLQRGQVNPEMLFKPFSFPLQNIGEKIATLNTLFNVMERGLGISAQETGSIAGHIQTAKEQDVISTNVSSRLGLYASMEDDFFDAWKRQIFKAMQAFMDEDFAVDVSAVSKELVDKMKKDYGFEFESIGKDTMRVKGKKSKLSVDAFLSSREGRSRQSQPQVAQVMFQGIAAIAANQDLAARIGPEKMIKMWNRALQLAGMPEDEKFKLDPEATSVMEQKKLMEMIQKFAKEILDQATQGATEAATAGAVAEVGKQVAPAIQQVGEAAAQAGQGVQQVGAEVSDLKAHTEQIAQLVIRIDNFIRTVQGTPQPPQMPPPGLPMAA